MKKISVVIGGLWGDEGKGHMTDILSAKLENTLTVRFNGGCQASHTVVTPDGKKYAFRHIGAGSFTGADTYLSEDFIVNPVFYSKERRSLFPIIPFESHDTYVNPNCLVTTYWDIYINQVVEVMRGKKKHGSRGLGINETIERSKYPEYKLTVMDLVDRNLLYFKLKRIEKYYVPQRLKEYGITISQMPLEYKTLFIEDDIVEMFMFYTDSFLSNVKIASDDIINRYYNHIVFEGALGLLLDQDSQFKPHVTHSNTGIKNVMTIFNKLKIEEKPDIYYMCRCYATKHGAGDFPGECSIDDYVNVVDETNVTNEFQGDLRFGILNLDLLAEAINKDLANLTVDANINICITCMDQVPGDIKYVRNDVCITATKEEFLKEFKTFMKEKLTQFDRLYITDGLTRENYREV